MFYDTWEFTGIQILMFMVLPEHTSRTYFHIVNNIR